MTEEERNVLIAAAEWQLATHAAIRRRLIADDCKAANDRLQAAEEKLDTAVTLAIVQRLENSR